MNIYLVQWPNQAMAYSQPNRKSRDSETNSPSRQLRFIDNNGHRSRYPTINKRN